MGIHLLQFGFLYTHTHTHTHIHTNTHMHTHTHTYTHAHTNTHTHTHTHTHKHTSTHTRTHTHTHTHTHSNTHTHTHTQTHTHTHTHTYTHTHTHTHTHTLRAEDTKLINQPAHLGEGLGGGGERHHTGGHVASVTEELQNPVKSGHGARGVRVLLHQQPETVGQHVQSGVWVTGRTERLAGKKHWLIE